jgi:hypothetical protein
MPGGLVFLSWVAPNLSREKEVQRVTSRNKDVHIHELEQRLVAFESSMPSRQQQTMELKEMIDERNNHRRKAAPTEC